MRYPGSESGRFGKTKAVIFGDAVADKHAVSIGKAQAQEMLPANRYRMTNNRFHPALLFGKPVLVPIRGIGWMHADYGIIVHSLYQSLEMTIPMRNAGIILTPVAG